MSSNDPSALEVEDCGLGGVLLLKPSTFRDQRGWLRELFRTESFEAATGVVRHWPQDNHSMSTRGVLRGIHYQMEPDQGKLVTCVVGRIFDVAVDLRRSSPTFGTWVGADLSAENGHQMWVPEGFGHGFLVLSETADIVYKLTSEYTPSGYRSVVWDDPDLAIEWPLTGAPTLSEKDRLAPSLRNADVFP